MTNTPRRTSEASEPLYAGARSLLVGGISYEGRAMFRSLDIQNVHFAVTSRQALMGSVSRGESGRSANG